ncbi:OmpA family protein [Humitalea rosea]|uniref:OmpA family protein n=1 Tax=Humitalea rosea TaxID=990373 RepID=A0A2W7HYA4_9PROT|nr:OmpA family protein [Humitalea rosea]PZW37658.1 OmpA family protein [Humitalea rosea]
MRRSLLLSLACLPLLAGCALFRGNLADQPPRIVFYTPDSAELDAQAKLIVGDAADLAGNYPTAPVSVLGFADPDGTTAENRALSARRAEVVATELRRLGVAPSRITVRPRGEVSFDAVPLESRRVEIRVGQ